MTPPGPDGADKSLGEVVFEVSEKASLLVREEIELAKAEVATKVKKLGRGAAVGAAAGVFVVFAVVMLLHTLAWFLVDAFDMPIWAGFAMVTLLLLLLALLAGLAAARLVSRGAPPTPDMAIEQAKLTRESLERSAAAETAGSKETS
ncbi:MAG: phage holin family protein [Thermoleophilaceae bacterium]